jgi:hypothetical protein
VARGGSDGEKREENSGTHHGSMIPADDARPKVALSVKLFSAPVKRRQEP